MSWINPVLLSCIITHHFVRAGSGNIQQTLVSCSFSPPSWPTTDTDAFGWTPGCPIQEWEQRFFQSSHWLLLVLCQWWHVICFVFSVTLSVACYVLTPLAASAFYSKALFLCFPHTVSAVSVRLFNCLTVLFGLPSRCYPLSASLYLHHEVQISACYVHCTCAHTVKNSKMNDLRKYPTAIGLTNIAIVNWIVAFYVLIPATQLPTYGNNYKLR